MKKFVTLFTDSYREFKSVRTITTMAMLAALAVILGMFSIEYGQFIRIGFSSIPNGIVAYLFGPTVSGKADRTVLSAAYACDDPCGRSVWLHVL